MKKYSHQYGFTLIEMLLYIAVVSGLLLGIIGFYTSVVDGRAKTQTINEINQQGTHIMSTILQTIRNASTITTPAIGASGSSLTLTVPTASLSPTLITPSGTILQMTEGSGSATPLSNSEVRITNFTVKNLSRGSTNGLVQVSFTISRVNPTGNNRFDFERTFTGSAEVAW